MILTVLAAAAMTAQSPKQAAKQAPKMDPPLTIPDGVTVKHDIVYATYGARKMHLDLYLPPASAKVPYPAVVYIHGGGWRNGNKNAFARQAAHMASKGFVGASIEYRLSGEATWPAAMNDAKAAVRWLRANAAQYKVDARHIGAAGGSAGGHLDAMLGVTGEVKSLEGDGGSTGYSSRVVAVAGFNPAVDLVAFGKKASPNATGSVSAFLGGSYAERKEIWELATPITHVSKGSAQFLFLHGEADTTVPIQQSLDMMDKLKAVGVYAEIMKAPGAAHGFFNRPPWFAPTLERMEQFFERTLR
ncbi:MAG: alpha/beta hydrolase [Bryobacteraceae bacterium]